MERTNERTKEGGQKLACSLSPWAAKECPNPIHEDENFESRDELFRKYRCAYTVVGRDIPGQKIQSVRRFQVQQVQSVRRFQV
jgi:hypothetical protein